jgi:hypothetical protein
VVVKGPVTGASYAFSGAARVQLLDPRDAVAVVRDPMFRAEGVVETEAAPSDRGRPNGSDSNG